MHDFYAKTNQESSSYIPTIVTHQCDHGITNDNTNGKMNLSLSYNLIYTSTDRPTDHVILYVSLTDIFIYHDDQSYFTIPNLQVQVNMQYMTDNPISYHVGRARPIPIMILLSLATHMMTCPVTKVRYLERYCLRSDLGSTPPLLPQHRRMRWLQVGIERLTSKKKRH